MTGQAPAVAAIRFACPPKATVVTPVPAMTAQAPAVAAARFACPPKARQHPIVPQNQTGQHQTQPPRREQPR